MPNLDQLTPARRHGAIVILGYLWVALLAAATYLVEHATDLQLPPWAIAAAGFVVGAPAAVATLRGTTLTTQYGKGDVAIGDGNDTVADVGLGGGEFVGDAGDA